MEPTTTGDEDCSGWTADVAASSDRTIPATRSPGPVDGVGDGIREYRIDRTFVSPAARDRIPVSDTAEPIGVLRT